LVERFRLGDNTEEISRANASVKEAKVKLMPVMGKRGKDSATHRWRNDADKKSESDFAGKRGEKGNCTRRLQRKGVWVKATGPKNWL